MDNTNLKVNYFSVQKLYKKSDFDQILKFNLDNIHYWNKLYTNHEQWIKTVIGNLIKETYERIAFGGFTFNITTQKFELSCSLIIKKNSFSPFLEVKNIIVLNQDDKKLAAKNQQAIIKYIIKYAEQRGFKKLITELSKEIDKDLINILLGENFVISGSHSGRYVATDEIIFLSYNLNRFYSHDPFDHLSTCNWILQKYLGVNKFKLERNALTLNINNEKEEQWPSYSFYTGSKFETLVKSKFNNKHLFTILPEYSEIYNKTNDITVKLNYVEISTLYVFDFTETNYSRGLLFKERQPIVFELEDIQELIEKSTQLHRAKQIKYGEVGGLLLISNSKHFNFEKIKKFVLLNQPFIYLKLGDFGSMIVDEMPIVFAYYPETDKTNLQIWGVGTLSNLPDVVDLNQKRISNNAKILDNDDLLNKNPSDGELLFNYIQNSYKEDSDEPFDINSIVWDLKDFEKHNRYNETNKVIIYEIINFIDLRNRPNVLTVSEILDEPNSFQNSSNIFDFYLSRNEINKLNSTIKIISPNSDSIVANKIFNSVQKMKKSLLPTVVILTAIQEEFLAVKNLMGETKEVTKKGTKYLEGIFKFNELEIAKIILREAGPTNVVAAVETERAINNFRPKCILFVGIAGSRKPHDFNIGDVIFPEEIIYYEVGKSLAGQFVSRPKLVNSNFTLYEIAKSERNKDDWKILLKNEKYINAKANLGTIASGEQIIESYESTIGKLLFKTYNQTAAVEMEGYGFAKAAERQGEVNKCLVGVIRGISDIISTDLRNTPEEIANRRPQGAKEFASETATAFAFWLLYKFLIKH